MIKAVTSFSDDKNMIRMLYAFLACTDTFSHDMDSIEFFRGRDNMTLKICMDLSGVTYGPHDLDWGSRLGTENVDSGFLIKALDSFIKSDKDPEYDKQLESMDWIWGLKD